jgi:hypothetical protein
MERKVVRCPCGAEFPAPAILPKVLHCPKCGEPALSTSVDPDGRVIINEEIRERPTPPLPVRKPHAPLVLLGGAGLVLAAGVLTMVVAFRRPTVAAPPVEAPTRRVPESQKRETTAGPARENTPPHTEPKSDTAELERRLGAAAERANMTGLVAAVLLNSGMPIEAGKLQNRLRRSDEEIQDLLQQLQKQGARPPRPERFRSGDHLTQFAGSALDPLLAQAFADRVRAWISGGVPGDTVSVTVLRAGEAVTFDIRFAERSADLMALARQADVAPPAAEPKPAPPTPLPPPVLADVRQRLAALPPYYRRTLPGPDRSRAETLLAAGYGSNDDALFLSGRFSELLRRAETEQQTIAARLRESEAKVAESATTTDTVLCKDRKIEGIVLESTDEFVKIKGRFGSVTIPRADIVSIEKGKGSTADFKAAYQAARGQKAELLKLLALARDQNAAAALALAAAAVLTLDPGEERCRSDLGLPRDPYSGLPEPVAADDRIEYLGKRYTPDQLRQELQSLGYVQVNGLWCEKVAKVFLIDNLYRDTAALQGATVQLLTHAEQDTVYDYRTRSWVPRSKLISTARYVGNGICQIEIAAPGPILEARIHARSQVARAGGAVSVSVLGEAGEKTGKLLYTVGAPGENDGTHDATDKVYGRDRFYVRATIQGGGMFLVSDSNDHGVFEVKYTYGKPLERLNGLLANRRQGGTDQIESGCREMAALAAQNDVLLDALADMRRRSDGLVYPREFLMPSRFSDVASRLKDPLAPDWNGMTRDQAFRLGSWWGALPPDERREFLTSYGIWCARTRWTRASH